MDNCLSCGLSLINGYLTLPWEDGDNASAYPDHSGHEKGTSHYD